MPIESNLLGDDKNVDLLSLLQSDPRMSISELSRRVKLSAPAVKERVTRLEEAGVIAGYRLDLNPKALGFPVEWSQGSTDSNVPMSLGISAITIDGGGQGKDAHALTEALGRLLAP